LESGHFLAAVILSSRHSAKYAPIIEEAKKARKLNGIILVAVLQAQET
jgi:hypothetical protein